MMYARVWDAQPLMFTPEVTGLATLSIMVRDSYGFSQRILVILLTPLVVNPSCQQPKTYIVASSYCGMLLQPDSQSRVPAPLHPQNVFYGQSDCHAGLSAHFLPSLVMSSPRCRCRLEAGSSLATSDYCMYLQLKCTNGCSHHYCMNVFTEKMTVSYVVTPLLRCSE